MVVLLMHFPGRTDLAVLNGYEKYLFLLRIWIIPRMPTVIGNIIICLIIGFNITDPFTVFRLQDV
jgi:hypothetical protein